MFGTALKQYTRVFDHGKIVLQEKIVVGKPATPTPTFTAMMQFITFNPEWGVPEGIKVNEIAPRLKSSGGGGEPFFLFGSSSSGGGSSSETLQRLGGLRVSLNGKPVDPNSVDWSSVDIRRYQFTQGAGGKNVLGVVKFRFPNKHNIYMHDTTDRHLFGDGQRAFSHGCMRTQNPLHLAEVLLAHDKGYSAAQIKEMVASGQTNEIALQNPIPVHIAYFTAEVDKRGKSATRPVWPGQPRSERAQGAASTIRARARCGSGSVNGSGRRQRGKPGGVRYTLATKLAAHPPSAGPSTHSEMELTAVPIAAASELPEKCGTLCLFPGFRGCLSNRA